MDEVENERTDDDSWGRQEADQDERSPLADDEVDRLLSWARARFPNQRQAGAVIADRYRLVELLGRGGQGSVWHAEDQNLGSVVAIKFVDALRYDHSQLDRLFHEEKDALVHGLRKCRGSDIARILDAGQDGEDRFLVMDLIEGRSLQELVEDLANDSDPARAPRLERLERSVGTAENPENDLYRGAVRYERAIARTIESLLDSLAAVHQAQIVHRDLKLPNIVLRPGGKPVIVDFGIAALTASQGDSERLTGTLHMLAPEQVRSQTTGRDPRIDLYQVGLILYALLTLREAFDPHKGDLVLGDILQRRFERLHVAAPWVSSELAAICERGFAQEPNDRYQSAIEFRDALRSWLNEQELPRWDPSRYEVLQMIWADERIERVLARDLRNDVRVFIETTGESMRARCRQDFGFVTRTVRALSQVEHTRILSYRDIAIDEEGVPRVVLKARAGRWLDERIERDGPLEAPQVRQLGIDLGEALQALHNSGDGLQRGHVHRGLDPAHILIEDEGERAALAGFSFVKPRSNVENSMMGPGADGEDPWLGWPRYPAPEQIRDKRTDHRVDLFGLGCVLHRAATGQDPAEDQQSGAHTIADERTLTKRIGKQPTSAILKCLRREPGSRFGNAAEFLAAWQESRFGTGSRWWPLR
ncbi:MAG: protein kinase [Planctomycetota bacterium]